VYPQFGQSMRCMEIVVADHAAEGELDDKMNLSETFSGAIVCAVYYFRGVGFEILGIYRGRGGAGWGSSPRVNLSLLLFAVTQGLK
jgi:hypothetical protein